ncbi:MAG: rhodanese-like domain-containing protein [Arcobacter sp.]|nr:MAG: rhodanese-like domain-containing protein [Arcobacter sp.]
MNTLIDLAPKDVEKLIDENIVMIDVRREEEWSYTGVIKNAHKMTFFDMFGNCDVPTWLKEFQKLVTSKEQQFVLICAHANRTRTIGDFLIQNHGYTNVSHLEGGMALWTDENRDVVFN